MRSRGWLFAGGMTAGVVAGWALAQQRLHDTLTTFEGARR